MAEPSEPYILLHGFGIFYSPYRVIDWHVRRDLAYLRRNKETSLISQKNMEAIPKLRKLRHKAFKFEKSREYPQRGYHMLPPQKRQ